MDKDAAWASEGQISGPGSPGQLTGVYGHVLPLIASSRFGADLLTGN